MKSVNRRTGRKRTDADVRELRLFRTYLTGRAAAASGHALDAPDLLYACVYGSPPKAPEPGSGFLNSADETGKDA